MFMPVHKITLSQGEASARQFAQEWSLLMLDTATKTRRILQIYAA